jgi:hemolysin III
MPADLGLDLRNPWSVWTHLFGLVAAVPATIVLLRAVRDDAPRRLTMLIYGLSMCACFAASSAYHAAQEPAHIFYRKLDHAAIFLKIAGTNTPIYFALFHGWKRWAPIVVLWALAAAGATFRLSNEALPDGLNMMIYIGMGWLGFLGYIWACRVLSVRQMNWVLAGGGFYTVGAVLDHFQIPVIVPGVWGSHETFHVFVLAGSLCFYLFILTNIANFPRQRDLSDPVGFPAVARAM